MSCKNFNSLVQFICLSQSLSLTLFKLEIETFWVELKTALAKMDKWPYEVIEDVESASCRLKSQEGNMRLI